MSELYEYEVKKLMPSGSAGISFKHLREARKDGGWMLVSVPNLKPFIVSEAKWRLSGKFFEREFKIPGKPMKMIINNAIKLSKEYENSQNKL